MKGYERQAKENTRKFTDTNYFVFLVSGVLGAMFFIYVYGFVVLNPTYTDWLLMGFVGGDTTAHFMGWEFFRNSDWHFPIGLSLGSTYPFRTSIMFSDSIPLFAIFFKTISFILPQDFQYFGWFGILMYILQGSFGGLIIKKLTNNTALSIIGSLFFTMSSFLTFRMFAHTALSAHFIILAAIYACITKDKCRSIFHNCLLWGGLLSLAVSIHPYFVVMVFIKMIFYFIDDIFEYMRVKKTIVEFGISMVMLVITMHLIGFFYSDAPIAAYGLGVFSTNINSIINPSGMSRFLQNMPLAKWGQYEGNAFIGFGMIILAFVALFMFIEDIKDYIKKLSEKRILRRVICCFLVFILFYILALSPVVTINDTILFTYSVPNFVVDIWSIFRATGRFIWPSVYMVMILVIWATAKKFSKTTSIFILLTLVFVQYQDMSGYFERKGAPFREVHIWETNLKSEMWGVIANDFNHLFYTSAVTNMNPILRFAAQNQLTVNDTYLARINSVAIAALKQDTLNMLSNGFVENNKVYIFQNAPAYLIFRNILYIYEFDGIIAGFARKIDNAEQMEGVVRFTSESSFDVMPVSGVNMRGATDTDQGRIISTSGATWTALFPLPPGLYTFEWTGYNLNNGSFDNAYWDEDVRTYQRLEMLNVERTYTLFKFSIYIPKDYVIERIQARVFNNSSEDILVQSVRFWKNFDCSRQEDMKVNEERRAPRSLFP